MIPTPSPAVRLILTLFAGIAACSLQAETLTWGPGGAGGVGTWNTTTANWWNGTSDVVWGGDGAVFAGTGTTVTIAAGGVSANNLTFDALGYLITSSSLALTGMAPTITANSDASLSSVITGSSGFTKLGSGILSLGAANTYTGITTISAGTLRITGGGVIPGDVLNNANLTFDRGNTQTYAGNISGNGSVTKAGTGIQTLTGSNSYTGATTVDNGTLIFGTAESLPAATSVALTSASGTVGGTVVFGAAPLNQTLLLRTTSDSVGTVALNTDNSNPLDFSARPSVSLGASGTATYSGVLTSGSSYRLGGGGGRLTVTSDLSGAHNAIINGGGSVGTVVLAGNNTYSGDTTINGGVLALGNNTAVGSGTLAFGATGAALSASGGARAISNPVYLPSTADHVSIFTGSNTLTLNGVTTADGASATARYITNFNTAPTIFNGGISLTLPGTPVTRNLNMTGIGNVTVNGFSSVWTGTVTAVSINSMLVGTLTVTGTSDFGGGIGSSSSFVRAYSHSTLVLSGTKTNAKQSHLSSITGGKILLDLAEGNNRWGVDSARSSLTMRGGILEVRGTTSGTRSQDFGTVTIQNARGSSTIVVNSNGGPGTTIFLGGNSWGGSGTGNPNINLNSLTPVGSLLLDVSAPNAFAKVFPVSRAYLLNNAPGGQDPTSGVAQYLLVKDSTGIGYATQITTGTEGANVFRDVVRYTGAAPLTAASTGTTTNFKIESSSVTLEPMAEGDGFNTLSIDTSAGSGTLDLGGNSVFTNGILFTGSNDYTISNGTLTGGLINYGASGARTAIFYHYGTGLLNFAGTVAQFVNFTKTGPGTLVATGSSQLISNLVISGGALRTALTGELLSGDESLQLTGGVLESNGVFTRPLTSALGGVSFGNAEGVAVGGGFAASGGTLAINLNGGTALVDLWANSGVSLYNGMALMLNSQTADSMVDFQNALSLGASSQAVRIIEVADNPNLTTDFARISGVISGATTAIGGTPLVKAGPGLLQFTATNTYTGNTTVMEGTLVVTSSGVINPASRITVKPDATFGGAGTAGQVLVESLGALLLESDVADANGLSLTSVTLSEDSSIEITLGTLNGMLTTPSFLAETGLTHINLNLNYSGVGLTIGQTLTLVNYTDTNFNTANVSQIIVSSVGPALVEGTLFWDTGDTSLKFTVTNAIPEPSTWLLGGLGFAFLVGLKGRRRKS